MVDTLNMSFDTGSAKRVASRRHSKKDRLNVASLPSAKEKHFLEDRMVALAMGGKLAKPARIAIVAQKAKGLAVTYKRGNEIIKEFPGGRKEVLGTIATSAYRLPKHVRIIGK